MTISSLKSVLAWVKGASILYLTLFTILMWSYFGLLKEITHSGMLLSVKLLSAASVATYNLTNTKARSLCCDLAASDEKSLPRYKEHERKMIAR